MRTLNNKEMEERYHWSEVVTAGGDLLEGLMDMNTDLKNEVKGCPIFRDLGPEYINELDRRQYVADILSNPDMDMKSRGHVQRQKGE